MTEYLITLSSSRYRLLKTTRTITSTDPEVARRRARKLLADYRARFIGGDDWDTWTLSLPGTGVFNPPVVASGTAEDC